MQPVILGDLGFSQATFCLWYLRVGDRVLEGERIAEVLVEAALVDVSAPISGKLVQRDVLPGDVLKTGQVLGWLE